MRSALAVYGALAAAAASGVLLAGVVGASLPSWPARPDVSGPSPESPVRPDEAGRFVARPVPVEESAMRAKVERLPPRAPRAGREAIEGPSAAADVAPPAAIVRLVAPFAIEDGAVLRARDIAFRLGRIVMPPGDAVCFDGERRLWACGARAVAALRNLMGAEEVACVVTDGEPRPPVGTCSAFGADLGRSLVALGFARPTAGSEAEFERDAGAARRAKRGLWNGGWTIR